MWSFSATMCRGTGQPCPECLRSADGLLVVGSSLMVYSGLRFCRYGRDWGKPMAALNLGRTRADDMLDLRLNARITETLELCLEQLGPP